MSNDKMTAKQLRQAILNEPVTFKKEPFEWNGKAGWIWSLTSLQMEQWRAVTNSDQPETRALSRAKMVQLSFRDEDGNLVFDPNQVTLLAAREADIIDEAFTVALRLNGYGAAGRADLLKNLKRTLGDDGLRELLADITAPLPNCSSATPPESSASNGSSSNTGPSEKRPTT